MLLAALKANAHAVCAQQQYHTIAFGQMLAHAKIYLHSVATYSDVAADLYAQL